VLGAEKVSEYEHLSHKELLLGCSRVRISACPIRLHADRQHMAGRGSGIGELDADGEISGEHTYGQGAVQRGHAHSHPVPS
jgi:hypothetical protein